MECILNLVDPSFDPGQVENYRISILLRPDGFSFCVLYAASEKAVALYDYRFLHSGPAPIRPETQFEKVISALSSIFNGSSQVLVKKVAFFTSKYTLIPEKFFRDEMTESYLKFNHPLESNEQVVSQQVPAAEMRVVFALPGQLIRQVESRYSVTGITSVAAVLITGLLKDHSANLNRQVFIHCWGNHFDIIIIQGNSLLYYNSFRKQAVEDLVYFVIYVLEQMGFIPAEEEVVLMGDIDPDSDEYNYLYQYINSIRLAEIKEVTGLSPALSVVPVHKYYPLLKLAFCE